MKVSNDQILIAFAKLYEKNQNINNSIAFLHKMKFLEEDKYVKLVQSLKSSADYNSILNAFNTKEKRKQKILFLSRYHSINDSIMITLNQNQQINKLKKEFISVIIYPTILVISTLLTMYFITTNILPKISMINQSAFDNYQFLITLLKLIPILIILFFLVILLSCCIFAYLYYYKKNILFCLIKKNFILSFIFKKYFSLSFSLIIKEILIHNNFDKSLIEQCINYYKNSLFIFELKAIYKELSKGVKLTRVIDKSNLLEQDFKNLIYISYDTKAFENLLEQYIEIKVTIYQSFFKKFLSILVPIVILICSIIIVSLYILIMLPTLEVEY